MTNYLNGARKERRIVNKARAEGKIAFRSAGSHSPIDLCIIDKEKKEIKFVQVKPKKFGKKAAERLEKELGWLNHNFKCSFEVLS